MGIHVLRSADILDFPAMLIRSVANAAAAGSARSTFANKVKAGVSVCRYTTTHSQRGREMQRENLKLSVDPQDGLPIWKQLEERVRRLVAAKLLPPGSPVPSVRDLARELRINPATVVRAYQRLTEDGILTVRRGEGTYVSTAPPAMAKTERTRLLREGAMRFVRLAATLGVTDAEVTAEIEAAWFSFGRVAKGAGK
jgi:GntR family transcriptional regulator